MTLSTRLVIDNIDAIGNAKERNNGTDVLELVFFINIGIERLNAKLNGIPI